MRDIGNWSSIRRYLAEIKKFAPLSAEEESTLARRIRQGDTRAFEKLVNANLRFVVNVANKYQGLGLPLQDLINEGNLGLVRAAQRFNAMRGFKFITYAVWWIRQAIVQSLSEHGRMVRLPCNRLNEIRKIGRVAEKLEQRCGSEPSLEEIAQGMAMTAEKVLEMLQTSTSHVSLDEPYTEDERVRVFEALESDWHPSPDAALLEESLQNEIDQMLATLKPREAEVIRMYFGLRDSSPQTLEQIGERLHLTRERVRQIREKALKHLRRQSSWELGEKYCRVRNVNL